jgi:hypothetical protein
MLVLEVWLSVVTNDPVCVGWRGWLLLGTGNFSAQVVVKTLEETFSEIHIADWVDTLGELNWTRKLAIAVAPVVFDALHMPLVY